MKSKSKINKERGKRIREFRISKGLDQTEFAQRMGYRQETISAIEIGTQGASLKFLEKAQGVHNLPINFVLYGSEEDRGKEAIVQEPPPVYNKELSDEEGLFANVREIMEGADIDLVSTIKANIRVFLGAARAAKEKRRYSRFLLNLPVDVQIMDELEARPGMVVNASQMGLLIQSAYDLPVGKKIDLKVAFQKTAGPESFRAKAEIIWKNKRGSEEAEQFDYGVKLIEVLNEGHAKLESLLRD